MVMGRFGLIWIIRGFKKRRKVCTMGGAIDKENVLMHLKNLKNEKEKKHISSAY